MSVTQRGFLVFAITCLPVVSTMLGTAAPERGGTYARWQDRKTPKLDRPGTMLREVGTCGDCHEDETAAIRGGVHAAVPDSTLLDRCETCHGPGSLHADENEAMQITQPAKLPYAELKTLCGRCHMSQIRHHGSLGEFEAGKKTCTECHSVHQLVGEVPGAADARRFEDKQSLDAAAESVGAARCAACHSEKIASLEGRTHAALAQPVTPASTASTLLENAGKKGWHEAMSCEACHGDGSLHASWGARRFITRPDHATDGDATCRSCHAEVDAKRFHWKDDPDPPFLTTSGTMRCTTCHVVHGDGDPTRAHVPVAREVSNADGGQVAMADASIARSEASIAADKALDNRACLPCHEPAYGADHVGGGKTHDELTHTDLPPGRGCVSCHPGGADHAASGGAPELVSSLRNEKSTFVAQTCNACHGGDRSVCGFSVGAHGRNEVGCLECHSPATGRSERAKILDANANCASCHAATALDFQHVNRHPVGEGLFHCSSCHDAHDPIEVGPSSQRRMARRCVECHKEFRGPFVFPHHADKALGCMACHKPHGSPNRKLLDQVRARDNCLQCHGDLPSFHDLTPGSRYQNCLDCHVKVHGSNRNRFFFR